MLVINVVEGDLPVESGPRCGYMKSGTTPSWLKSFAARKKPKKLEQPAVAAPGVDESAATCYMADELLQCMEGYSNGGSAHRSDFVGLDSATSHKPKPLNPKA